MKKLLIITSIIIVGVIVGLALSNNKQSQISSLESSATSAQRAPAAVKRAGIKAPAFSLQDYQGQNVTLSDFAGRPLVINSWAAWCPFCRKELVDFAAAQKEFGGEVVIIAIDRAESLSTAKKYSDELGVTGDLVFLLDPADSFYKSIGGFSMPETIFVDKDGNIIDHKRGPMDLDEIRQRIQKMLVPTPAPSAQTPEPVPVPAAVINEAKESEAENIVTYTEAGFSPTTIGVTAGATVIFKNDSGSLMWVASNPHPIHTDYIGFDARRGHGQGESYTFTFSQAGTWQYHNHLNPGKGGVIIVE